MPAPTEKDIKDAIEVIRQVGKAVEIGYSDGEKMIVVILREKPEPQAI